MNGNSPHLEEKDFVLFVDENGRYSGDFEPADAELEDTPPQGPINEETGEINWDCPCLQSALAPPCGEFFREAFACFVASKTEPKGSDCLEKFSAMQECFKSHPEIYLNPGDQADQTEIAESVASHPSVEEHGAGMLDTSPTVSKEDNTLVEH